MTNVEDLVFTGTTIARNTAVRGGGMRVQQRSRVQLRDVIVRHCTAQRGAGVVVSSDSVVDAHRTAFIANEASINGGAVGLDGQLSTGSNAFLCSGCLLEGNVAAEQGGGAHCLSSHINATHSVWQGNNAAFGGGAWFSATCTHASAGVVWAHNAASRGGGAAFFADVPAGSGGGDAYFHPALHAVGGVSWAHMAVVDNSATAGGGMYWQLPLPYTATAPLPSDRCSPCRFSANAGGNVATSGVFSAPLPMGSSRLDVHVASGMQVQDYVASPASVPTAAVMDALSSPAGLDDTTVCALAIDNSTDPTATLAPATLRAQGGVVSFGELTVLGDAGARISVVARCEVQSPIAGTRSDDVVVDVTVAACLPAWELSSSRVCKRCLQGYYSDSGAVCKLCPAAAECQLTITEGEQTVCAGMCVCVCVAGLVVGARATVHTAHVYSHSNQCAGRCGRVMAD